MYLNLWYVLALVGMIGTTEYTYPFVCSNFNALVQHNVLLAIKPFFKLCGPRSMFSRHRELESSLSGGLHLLSSLAQES